MVLSISRAVLATMISVSLLRRSRHLFSPCITLANHRGWELVGYRGWSGLSVCMIIQRLTFDFWLRTSDRSISLDLDLHNNTYIRTCMYTYNYAHDCSSFDCLRVNTVNIHYTHIMFILDYKHTHIMFILDYKHTCTLGS